MKNCLRPYFVSALLIIGPLVQPALALKTELFGNGSLGDADYKDWPGIMSLVNDQTRVYQSWVNGIDRLYYKGDMRCLNAALRVFAGLKLEKREVVLVPGPCVVPSSKSNNEVTYNWKLQIRGGIARTTPGHVNPVLTVVVSSDTDLSELKIPEAVTVTSGGQAEDKTAAEGRERTEITEKIEAFIAARRGTD